eukprot:Rhum_TRINITY_DN473_c0_g1::Rhum_TRINITY_DN473_c0_g1_i1::g.1446::m.1446
MRRRAQKDFSSVPPPGATSTGYGDGFYGLTDSRHEDAYVPGAIPLPSVGSALRFLLLTAAAAAALMLGLQGLIGTLSLGRGIEAEGADRATLGAAFGIRIADWVRLYTDESSGDSTSNPAAVDPKVPVSLPCAISEYSGSEPASFRSQCLDGKYGASGCVLRCGAATLQMLQARFTGDAIAAHAARACAEAGGFRLHFTNSDVRAMTHPAHLAAHLVASDVDAPYVEVPLSTFDFALLPSAIPSLPPSHAPDARVDSSLLVLPPLTGIPPRIAASAAYVGVLSGTATLVLYRPAFAFSVKTMPARRWFDSVFPKVVASGNKGQSCMLQPGNLVYVPQGFGYAVKTDGETEAAVAIFIR